MPGRKGRWEEEDLVDEDAVRHIDAQIMGRRRLVPAVRVKALDDTDQGVEPLIRIPKGLLPPAPMLLHDTYQAQHTICYRCDLGGVLIDLGGVIVHNLFQFVQVGRQLRLVCRELRLLRRQLRLVVASEIQPFSWQTSAGRVQLPGNGCESGQKAAFWQAPVMLIP